MGCIGCPMNYNRERELEAYPKYKASYLRAFGRMITERNARGLGVDDVFFKSPQAVMNWCLEKTQAVQIKLDGQMDIEDLMEVQDE